MNKSVDDGETNKELFSEILGGGSKDEEKLKEKKREEKKKLVDRITSTK